VDPRGDSCRVDPQTDFDNVTTKFMVNNRTDAWKTDVNLFFTIRIVRSCSLTHPINYKFMWLSAYWQITNGKRQSLHFWVMDARGRLLSTKERKSRTRRQPSATLACCVLGKPPKCIHLFYNITSTHWTKEVPLYIELHHISTHVSSVHCMGK